MQALVIPEGQSEAEDVMLIRGVGEWVWYIYEHTLSSVYIYIHTGALD